MKPSSIRLGARASVMMTTAFAALVGVANHASALTAANTVIQNQATATYEDAGGNKYTAQSNLAEITVQQVYAADITRNITRSGVAGQPVYTTHVLTNIGNGADTYNISVAQLVGTDTADFDRLRVYHDGNGNGRPDAGEALIADSAGATGTVTLDPNDPNLKSANLVIEGLVPAGAASDDEFGAIVTAVASEGSAGAAGTWAGPVTDSSAAISNGAGTQVSDNDAATPGTNHMLITVTNDAVIDITKASVVDDAAKTITYTVTAANNGGKIATGVVLYDQLPVLWYDKNGDGVVDTSVSHPDYPTAVLGATGAADELVPLALVSPPIAAGLVAADTAVTFGAFDEATNGYGVDMNGDGAVDALGEAVYAIDDSLAPGTSVSISFTVSYDPAMIEAVDGGTEDVPNTVSGVDAYAPAGTDIKNTALALGDLDGDPGTTPTDPEPSNPTTENIPAVHAIEADDSGDGAGTGTDTTNDGLDDDGALDDVQTVDSAAEGEIVLFTVPISNNGNVIEPVELVLDPANTSTYPPGTVFQFWSESGSVQLTDTDDDGVVNTPPLEPGETYNMIVKAILPNDVNPALTGPFTTEVAAYPSGAEDTDLTNDTGGDSQSNVTLSLTEIRQGGVDMSNSASTGAGSDQDAYTLGGTTPTTTTDANPGDTVDFNLWIQNDGGSPDAFQLYAGASWTGTQDPSSIGVLEPGWSVLFYEDADNDGVADGGAVTTTRSLSGGASLKLIARVQVPSDSQYALANFQGADVNADSTPDEIDGNDGGAANDGDYPILFMAKSVTTGAADVKLDAVDVNEVEDFTVLTDQSNQIAPGGSSTTPHTVENTGNTPNVFTPSVDNGDPSWGEIVEVTLPTGETVPFDSLNVGDQVVIEDPNGNPVTVTLVDNGGVPGVPLNPGEVLPVEVTVFAPSNSPNGSVVNTVLTVTDQSGVTGTNNITNTVVIGKLRLEKTASVDATCADAATLDLGPDTAFQETGQFAAPGDCVVWQVVATNTGVEFVERVVIEDTVPAFTAYETGTMRYCVGAPATCAGNWVDAAVAPVGTITGDDLKFDFSAVAALGDTAGSPAGDDLSAGASVTVRFSTRVE